MTGCIGFFRPESGAKGINAAESHCHAFGLQLAGNRQAGHFSEKVLTVIYRSILSAGGRIGVERGHMEHFAGAFAVAAGNQRRMGIDKAPLVEKTVDGKSRY